MLQTDCEPDGYAFVKEVFDEIEAEQRVEENSECDPDVRVVNKPVILLNQASEKMRELMGSFEYRIDKTKLIGSIG